METMNRYQHVRLRPGMYGLHGNFFHGIFSQSILDLLHEYSFSRVKISTDPKRNQVVFEASERTDYRVANEECTSFLAIAGISSSARFSGERRDGSYRRTIIEKTKEIENAFDFHPDPALEHLEYCFFLPEKFPIDENYARGTVDRFSKIFPDSRIIYNDHEYHRGGTKNKMTDFLLLGHHCDPCRSLGRGKYEPFPVPIYEFSDKRDGLSWEVSFTFAPGIKKTSINLFKKARGETLASSSLSPWTFINGIRTLHGGTHVDYVTRAIEQAFRQTENAQDIRFENMTLAVSVHLPSGTAIHFDSCRCCEDNLKLTSEHPEFKLMERNLKSQIVQYLSETTKRGAK